MPREVEDEIGVGVAALGARLLERADELADELAERIRSAVPIYRTDVVSADALRRTCLANVRYIFGPLGRVAATTSPESRENGMQRARAGVPLAAVMEAYRVAARYLWEQFAAAATGVAAPAEVILRAAGEIWLVQDTYTQEMADGFREEITVQVLNREAERSALVQALLDGRVDDTNLWEAADVLRLPQTGPYAVVVAQVPDLGRHALPRVEQRLAAIGIPSAWRLLHDVEIGVASLPDSRLDRLVTILESARTGRAGVSPPYDDLRDTADAVRLARIALHSAFDEQQVVVFYRDPLAVIAAGAPDVMRRVAGMTLAGLDGISVSERALLLRTFGVWLDSDGSADQAAKALFCHPNTVRHRLRRLEERTGRSLNDPRWIAELTLAFEIDRRLSAGP